MPWGLEFDGCACSEGVVDGTYLKTHCHRTSPGCNCAFAGVHYRGDIEVAKRVAKYIADAYACEVGVVEMKEADDATRNLPRGTDGQILEVGPDGGKWVDPKEAR